jgi:tetratricopeptide (TPR) repeat protein
VKVVKWFLVGSLCLFCSITWVRADAAADLYNQGVASLQNQKYDDAAQSFQKILDSYPTFQDVDEAHILAGQSYLFGGRFAQAVTALQKEAAANAKPEYRAQGLFLTALAQFSAAQKNTTADKVDTAGYTIDVATLSTLIDFIAANPTPDNKTFLEQALYYRSLANYEIDKYDPAAADLVKLTTDPAFSDSLSIPDYYLQLGDIYAVQTNNAVQDKRSPEAVTAAANKAVETFDQAISDPNALVQANEASMAKAQVYTLVAELDNSSDSYQKALDAYRQVRRKADLIPAQQQRLDDLRKKEQQNVQDLANHPGGNNFNNQLSLIIKREQDTLDKLQTAPDPIIEALIGIAECYVNITGPDGKKESDEARTILHRLINNHIPLTPDQQQKVDFYILFSYVLGGQTDKADAALTDYLTKHAKDPQADFISFQVATELFKRKDYTGALKSAQRSLHDFPNGRYLAPATTLEARALTALGRVQESNDIVNKFLTDHPNSPEAYAMILSRAANEAADGDLPAALADYGKVKDTAAAGAETQAGADAGYIQTLQRMQKYDQLIAEAKVYETKYSGGKALSVVMLFAAQALEAKNDPGAVAALQEVARKFPQDPIVAPLALFYVVDIYHRAGNLPLMVQAAKDLQTACPDAYTQILLADDAVSDALQKQKPPQFDEAAAFYDPLTKASDAGVAAEAQNKIGDVRFAQAKAFHYQSLPPDQRPGAEKVLSTAEDAYLATLKNSPDQLNAVGTAIEGLVSVAKLRRSWGVFKDDTDYEPYLSQVSKDLTSPEMPARFELAKAGLCFVVKNGATQYPAALDRYKKVIAANPSLHLTRQETDQFGDLLLNAKDYDNAQKVYEDLLDNSSPNDAASLAIAYYGLGAVALAQGNLPQAKENFLSMEKLPGGAAWSLHLNDANFGIAAVDEKSTAPADWETAKNIYGQLMKSMQAGAALQTKALVGYGRILEKQGFTLKPAPQGPNEYAVHYYQQPNLMFFTATPEQSAEGLYLAGQVYDKSGDKANAKKQYDTILSTYKDLAPDWAAKAQAAEGQ